ncbi:MAG: hypothetical protein ACREOW_03140 [Thermodesulfobacteriota bacterium]
MYKSGDSSGQAGPEPAEGPVLSPEYYRRVEGSKEWLSYRCLCITVGAADTKLSKRKISPLGRNDTLSCHLECVNFASIPSLLYPRLENLGYPPP